MKKAAAQHYQNQFPEILRFASEHFQYSYPEAFAESIHTATGISGLILKIFGSPLIDSYYARKNKNKLQDYGLQTYLKAALLQAEQSCEKMVSLDNFPKGIFFAS